MLNHLKGRLWFRSAIFLQKYVGVGSDELEGIGSYEMRGQLIKDVSDDISLHPLYFLCFSETSQASSSFGEHRLRLDDPEGLRNHVESRIYVGGARVFWRKITYDKKMQVESHPNPDEEWDRMYYHKPPRYSHEREWRLVVDLSYGLPLLNGTLKLLLGLEVGQFFELVPLIQT